MSKAKVYDRDGYELDDNGQRIVRDGQHVRTPMMFSDGGGTPTTHLDATAASAKAVRDTLDAQIAAEGRGFLDAGKAYLDASARPGHRGLTDAERERREQMYRDRDAKLSNAWKGNKESEDA
ncbi:MAG: hypothetical protein IT536_08320 [Hyphomicrobiales bacterium]|nr:hypothetical protein [Hyphomicrobiales bacterium]